MGSKRTSDHSENVTSGYLKAWKGGVGIIDLTMSATETLHDTLASKIVGDEARFIRFDEQPGEKKSNVLALDNASDEAIDILRASADLVARENINADNFDSFIKHIAPAPIFLHGPNRIRQEEK